MNADLTDAVKQVARAAGADLVGIGSVSRFDHAPADVHPCGILSETQSVIAIGCRMVRGALKTIEEGTYWQAYNCDSYQYLNEILAPHILRKIVLLLEDHGFTAVPIHNPFGFHSGEPVRPGGTRPDGALSLRVIGCATGLGELGLSKLLLTPQFGPRQRIFAVLTDARLAEDPLVAPGSVCDSCGACRTACPAGAIPSERSVEVRVGDAVYSHGELDCAKCSHVHQGWDPRFSPFLREDSSRENPPPYYKFLQHRFRHLSICGGRGCVRACMDHLEKTGRIERKYVTPMIEGGQWEIDRAGADVPQG
jgi:epoxyqueuosine reductase QueG